MLTFMLGNKGPWGSRLFQGLSYISTNRRSFNGTRTLSDLVQNPTIYALSTHLTRSAIGVIRISGSQSKYILDSLAGKNCVAKHRMTSVRKLYSPKDKMLIDEALTIFFKSPGSYTGEDMLELHLHGGTALIQTALRNIQSLHDPSKQIYIRYAENGEFSRRAFMNGRFDLTELEGIREMIDAETESQRIAALTSMKGETRSLFSNWREEIVKNIAMLTTIIDFGEDHDIEEVDKIIQGVSDSIDELYDEILKYLERVTGSEVLLKGIKLTFIGPPNAGKSSLLNYISDKDMVIVSDIAGTTRDVIDVPININGYKVILGDTAGIRSSSDVGTIEFEGIKRAKMKSLSGDIILVVLPIDEHLQDHAELMQHISSLKEENKRILVVLNKLDLLPSNRSLDEFRTLHAEASGLSNDDIFTVSCATGEGTKELTSALTSHFKEISKTTQNDPVIISTRAQDLLKNDVLYGFEQFKFYKDQSDVVLATESLRQSVDGIAKITGEAVGVEEILGVVFSKFCIGK